MSGTSTRGSRLYLLLAVLVGVALGLGAFTFHYAEGGSYLSSDPTACVNCHIMRPQYDSWQKASHHAHATCVECHLPQEGLEKYLAKAKNGWSHSKAFTLEDFPEPILITDQNAAILQDNCLRCHGALLHHQLSGATSDTDAVRCVHCHRSVGHGETVGLGGPDRGEEAETSGS